MCKYAHMIGDRNEPFLNVLENRNNVLSVSHQVSDCEKEGFNDDISLPSRTSTFLVSLRKKGLTSNHAL